MSIPLLAAACCILAYGCATATLDVISPVAMQPAVVSIAILDDTGGDMSADQVRDLKRTITRELLDSGIDVLPSPKAGTARVVGSVVRYAPGIRALRFISRYGLGTGALESVWDVRDSRSNALARCRIEGSVSMGTFGGSFQDVQEETGKALARFLKGDIQ